MASSKRSHSPRSFVGAFVAFTMVLSLLGFHGFAAPAHAAAAAPAPDYYAASASAEYSGVDNYYLAETSIEYELNYYGQTMPDDGYYYFGNRSAAESYYDDYYYEYYPRDYGYHYHSNSIPTYDDEDDESDPESTRILEVVIDLVTLPYGMYVGAVFTEALEAELETLNLELEFDLFDFDEVTQLEEPLNVEQYTWIIEYIYAEHPQALGITEIEITDNDDADEINIGLEDKFDFEELVIESVTGGDEVYAEVTTLRVGLTRAATSYATVVVRVGGIRTKPNAPGAFQTDGGWVSPLDGAQFQLWTAVRGSNNLYSPGEAITHPWAFATSGAANRITNAQTAGYAQFSIPLITSNDQNTATGGSGASLTTYRAGQTSTAYVGAAGAYEGARFFVKQLNHSIAVHTNADGNQLNWRFSDWLRTGGPNGNHESRNTPYNFITAGIQGGITQTSGSEFMNTTGFNRSDFLNVDGNVTALPTTNTGPNNPESVARTRSHGVWPAQLSNPPLMPQCAMNIAVVLDMTSSIGEPRYGRPEGYRPLVTQAAVDFVSAMTGTAARISSYAFGWQSPMTVPAAGQMHNGAWVTTGANIVPVSESDTFRLQTVVNSAERDGLINRLNNWRAGSEFIDGRLYRAQATNWNMALYRVAEANANRPNPADRYDVVLFVTDGNPTWASATTSSAPASGNESFQGNRLRDVEEAIFSANLLKSQGSRVVTLGVGDAVEFIDPLSHQNFYAVSGTNMFTLGGTQANILDADFIRVTSFDQLGRAFGAFASANCTPVLNVQKQTVPSTFGSDPINNHDTLEMRSHGTLAQGWEFTTEIVGQTGALSLINATNQAQSLTTDNSGVVTFDFNNAGTAATTVRITETQQPGWTLVPQQRSISSSLDDAFCTYQTFVDGTPTTRQVSISKTRTDGEGNPFIEFQMGYNWMVNCLFVNRPLVTSSVDHIAASGVYGTSFDWDITKQVWEQGLNHGEGGWVYEFSAPQPVVNYAALRYRIVVQAQPGETSGYVATGTFTLSGHETGLGASDNLAVTFGTQPATLYLLDEGPRTLVDLENFALEANETATLQAVATFDTTPTDLNFTLTLNGESQSVPVDTWISNGTVRQTATLRDTFPEFNTAFAAEVTLNATTRESNPLASNVTTDGQLTTWYFEYQVTRGGNGANAWVGTDDEAIAFCAPGVGGNLDRDASTSFRNTATLTVDGAETDKDAIALLCTGQDLTVTVSGNGYFSRNFPWQIVKQVLDITATVATAPDESVATDDDGNVLGVWRNEAVQYAGADNQATFQYRVQVRPGNPQTSWLLTVNDVVVTNPNPWPVPLQSAAATITLGSTETSPTITNCDLVSASGAPTMLPPASASGPGTRTVAVSCQIDIETVTDIVQYAELPADIDITDVSSALNYLLTSSRVGDSLTATIAWQAVAGTGTGAGSASATPYQIEWRESTDSRANFRIAVWDDKTVAGAWDAHNPAQPVLLGVTNWLNAITSPGGYQTFYYSLTVDGPVYPATETEWIPNTAKITTPPTGQPGDPGFPIVGEPGEPGTPIDEDDARVKVVFLDTLLTVSTVVYVPTLEDRDAGDPVLSEFFETQNMADRRSFRNTIWNLTDLDNGYVAHRASDPQGDVETHGLTRISVVPDQPHVVPTVFDNPAYSPEIGAKYALRGSDSVDAGVIPAQFNGQVGTMTCDLALVNGSSLLPEFNETVVGWRAAGNDGRHGTVSVPLGYHAICEQAAETSLLSVRKIVLDLVEGTLDTLTPATAYLTANWMIRITADDLPAVDFAFPDLGRTWGASFDVDGYLTDRGIPRYLKVRPNTAYAVELWAPAELASHFELVGHFDQTSAPSEVRANGGVPASSQNDPTLTGVFAESAADTGWAAYLAPLTLEQQVARAAELNAGLFGGSGFEPSDIYDAAPTRQPAKVYFADLSGVELLSNTVSATSALLADQAVALAEPATVSREMVLLDTWTGSLAPLEVVEVTWVSAPRILVDEVPQFTPVYNRQYVTRVFYLTQTGADLLPLLGVAALVGVGIVTVAKAKRRAVK